jgi:hypothetical protein
VDSAADLDQDFNSSDTDDDLDVATKSPRKIYPRRKQGKSDIGHVPTGTTAEHLLSSALNTLTNQLQEQT